MVEKRLGKGLGSLLGGAPALPDSPAATAEVPLDAIARNPFQPREVFDEEGLRELSESIRRHGVLQPVCLRRSAGGYQLISGERRLRAARMAGLTALPAVVREGVSDGEMLELALVENIQRRDLDPIEKAKGYQEMIDRLDLTQDQVAERVGLGRATIANHLRLLDLPLEVQQALSEGLITMGHARALLGLPAPPGILRLLGRIVREGLSVRDVEAAVRLSQQPSPASPPAERPKSPAWVREMEQRIQDRLGTRTAIHNRAGYSGQIILHYHSREELERVLERLAPTPEL